MAEKIKSLPDAIRGGGRAPIYPWPQWTDGDAWVAYEGRDFDCTPKGFEVSLRRHADTRGLKVSIRHIGGDPEGVAFQFRERGERNGQAQANGGRPASRKVRRSK